MPRECAEGDVSTSTVGRSGGSSMSRVSRAVHMWYNPDAITTTDSITDSDPRECHAGARARFGLQTDTRITGRREQCAIPSDAATLTPPAIYFSLALSAVLPSGPLRPIEAGNKVDRRSSRVSSYGRTDLGLPGKKERGKKIKGRTNE